MRGLSKAVQQVEGLAPGHREHRRPDAAARPQRHDRGRAGRRGRARLRGRGRARSRRCPGRPPRRPSGSRPPSRRSRRARAHGLDGDPGRSARHHGPDLSRTRHPSPPPCVQQGATTREIGRVSESAARTRCPSPAASPNVHDQAREIAYLGADNDATKSKSFELLEASLRDVVNGYDVGGYVAVIRSRGRASSSTRRSATARGTSTVDGDVTSDHGLRRGHRVSTSSTTAAAGCTATARRRARVATRTAAAPATRSPCVSSADGSASGRSRRPAAGHRRGRVDGQPAHGRRPLLPVRARPADAVGVRRAVRRRAHVQPAGDRPASTSRPATSGSASPWSTSSADRPRPRRR